MGGFGSPWHWLVIGVVALLLFGNRLPEVARSLGRAFNEFKRGLREVGDEMGRESDGESDRRRDRIEGPPTDDADHRVEHDETPDPYGPSESSRSKESAENSKQD